MKLPKILSLLFLMTLGFLPISFADNFYSGELLAKINKWFEDATITVLSLSRNPVFRDKNVAEIKMAFKEKMERNPEIINIFYGATESYFRLNSLDTPLPKSFNYKGRPWFYQALARNELVFTEPYIDINTQDSVVTIAAPVKDSGGKIHGIVGADILVNSIVSLLNRDSQRLKKEGIPNLVFIMNNQGDELISSFQGVTNGFVKRIGNKISGVFDTENMLTNRARFHKLGGLPWFLIEFSSEENSNFPLVYQKIEHFLKISREKITGLTSNSRIQNGDDKEVTRLLQEGLKGFAHCKKITFLNLKNKKSYSSSNRGQRKPLSHFQNKDWFLKSQHSKEIVVSNKALDPHSKKQIITLAQPLYEKGVLRGVLAADLELDLLIESLKTAENLCCLMNQEGHIVLSKNSDTMKSLVVDKIAWQKKYHFKEKVESNRVPSELEFNRIHLCGWYLIMQKFSSTPSQLEDLPPF